MSTQVSGKCPIIGETLALELISEIETQKLKELERANEEGHLRTILEGTAELRDWKDFLSAYVASGRRQHGLEALMVVGFPLGPVPEAIRSLLVETVDLSDKAGWKYLQALPVKRSVRRPCCVRNGWFISLLVRRGPPL